MHCRRPLIALLLALTALLPVSCGGDGDGKPLSHTAASELRAGLDSVQQDIEAGDCQAATDSALELEQRTANLPTRVDADLRDALEAGVARLGNLVRDRCPAQQSEGATGPTTPPVAETGPTGGETTPTDGSGEGDQQDKKAKKEKPSKPGKGKNKDENGGSTEPPSDTPPSDGGQGQDFGTDGNQDSGGATP